jgi:hypothetical protein
MDRSPAGRHKSPSPTQHADRHSPTTRLEMVSLNDIGTSNDNLGKSNAKLIALFIGATSDIGKGTL